jgi:hypothetical protein
MKTFEEFLTEKAIPKPVENVISNLENDDAKILDFKVKKIKGIETHHVYTQIDDKYEVYEITGTDVITRDMDSAEKRRYKTGV